MNGFKWNKNKDGFKVNIDPRFLSRAFCLSYSYDIIQQAGKWEKWYRGRTVAGLTRIEIAAECYTHALLYYASNVTIKLIKRGYNWNDAGRIINVDRGDYRQWQFTAVWYTMKKLKYDPSIRRILCVTLGYGIWLSL